MKQDVPKAVRQVLARQVAADEHPSADLLNAYMERSLGAAENSDVANHLAACADCREIVFLASAAAKEPAVAAATVEPRRGWLWWKWAVPAVAAMAVVSGVFLEQHSSRRLAAPIPTASNKPAAAPSAKIADQEMAELARPMSAPSPAVEGKGAAEGTTKATRTAPVLESRQPEHDRLPTIVAKAAAPRPAETAKVDQLAGGTALNRLSAGNVPQISDAQPASEVSAAKQLQEATGVQPKAGMLGSTSFKATQTTDAASAPFGLAKSKRVAVAGNAMWRVTADGQLERLSVGGWTRMLAEKRVSFQAVSVTGDDVWAGGSNGALFHSVDGGEHWKRVALAAEGHVETGAVVAIRFDTAVQGSVTSDSGVVWITSNGGQSWTRQ